jgi:hypothetical protein
MDQRLLRLAGERPARREEGVLRQLLGEGAAALRETAGSDVGDDGAQDGDGIDAGVAEEVAVFRGQHRVAAVVGHGLGRRFQRAALAAADGERLGSELESSGRPAAVERHQRSDTPVGDRDLGAARLPRPRDRHVVLPERDATRIAAERPRDQLGARPLDVAQTGEHGHQPLGCDRRAGGQRLGCGEDPGGADRRPFEVRADAGVDADDEDRSERPEDASGEQAGQDQAAPPTGGSAWGTGPAAARRPCPRPSVVTRSSLPLPTVRPRCGHCSSGRVARPRSGRSRPPVPRAGPR